jgi:glycosyltransferase involved in cell wall biosynthesis
MRIALSNASVKWGGVHNVTEDLVRGLQAKGHEVVLLTSPDGLLAERMKGTAPIEPVLKGMDLHPVALARIRGALRRHRSEVVLAMMKKDVRLTVPAAWSMGIPSVVRHANDRPLTGWIYDRLFFGSLPKLHIANSEATRQTLLSSASWLDGSAIEVIYNGMDVERFASAERADLGLPETAFVIGFVGRLERRKGLIDLANAWDRIARAIPSAHLAIVGKGPAETEARELLRNAPHVSWLGYRTDVASVLKAMDILAVPSHWEGFGFTAAEAMAAGVPVVAGNSSSLPEIIDDGITGRLTPPRDPEGLADVLIELVRDPAARARMAEAAAEKVRQKFAVERMVHDYERVLERVRSGR